MGINAVAELQGVGAGKASGQDESEQPKAAPKEQVNTKSTFFIYSRIFILLTCTEFLYQCTIGDIVVDKATLQLYATDKKLSLKLKTRELLRCILGEEEVKKFYLKVDNPTEQKELPKMLITDLLSKLIEKICWYDIQLCLPMRSDLLRCLLLFLSVFMNEENQKDAEKNDTKFDYVDLPSFRSAISWALSDCRSIKVEINGKKRNRVGVACTKEPKKMCLNQGGGGKEGDED